MEVVFHSLKSYCVLDHKLDILVAVVGGDQREYKSTIYETPLCTKTGRIVKMSAYSLESITGPLSQYNI